MIAPEQLEDIRKDAPLDGEGEELFLRLVEKKGTTVPKDSLVRLRKRISDERKHAALLLPHLDRHASEIAAQVAKNRIPPDTFWEDQIRTLDLVLLSILLASSETGMTSAISAAKSRGHGVSDDQLEELKGGVDEWAKQRSSDVAASMVETSKDRTTMLIKRAAEQDLDEDETTELIRDRVNVEGREKNVAAFEVGEAHENAANQVWEAAGAIGILWTTFEDSKVCEICEPLDGVVVDVGDTFISKEWEGERPPVHNRCRCMTTPVFPSEEE
jgi:SPP1 gp7 family putative phage head morphogenesis protein